MNGDILLWLYYCTINGGFVFVLTPISWYYANRHIKLVSLPFALLFLASNIFIFQPYSWDNGKFVAYACLWSSGLVGDFFSKAFHKYRHSEFSLIIVILILYASIFSGAMDLINVTQFEHQKNHFFTKADILFGEKIRSVVPKKATLLTLPVSNYVTMLSGRQLFIGSDFWVSSYGINTQNRIRIVNAIYAGEKDAISLLEKHNLNYIVISSLDNSPLPPNMRFIHEHFEVILQNSTATIYRLRN